MFSSLCSVSESFHARLFGRATSPLHWTGFLAWQLESQFLHFGDISWSDPVILVRRQHTKSTISRGSSFQPGLWPFLLFPSSHRNISVCTLSLSRFMRRKFSVQSKYDPSLFCFWIKTLRLRMLDGPANGGLLFVGRFRERRRATRPTPRFLLLHLIMYTISILDAFLT